MSQKPINIQTPINAKKLLWLADLHCDRASESDLNILLESLAGIDYDAAVITGDVSSAPHLRRHLAQLARACSPRPVYFVLGNHDYHYSSIREVDQDIRGLCEEIENLHHLDGGQIIPLGNNACLVGHRGWADARAGYGPKTYIDSPDRRKIRDFQSLSRSGMLARMRELGLASANAIRRVLPLALAKFRHVVMLTHVPPYPETVLYDNAPCAMSRLPHFVNYSLGLAMRAIAKAFPKRRITILSGHSHSRCSKTIGGNITVRVGHARTGSPGIQDVIHLC